MEEPLELWPQEAREQVRPRVRWSDRDLFLFKSGILLITTLALIPILAWQHELAATLYVAFLVAVHIVGLGVFAYGVRKEHFGHTPRQWLVRIGGLVVLTALLWLASKGLHTDLQSGVFWVSLGAIWVLHTAGAAILHLRPGRRVDGSLCPFI